ncbi:MAG TPA: hypothetical protein PLV59_00780 [Candidatus Dojkabacteria bacterium]|nr:hypothetical protein [Candidatus Dojkabacteria bacterium]
MIPFKGIENRADIADLKPGNRVLIKGEHDLIIIGLFNERIDEDLSLGICYIISSDNNLKPFLIDLTHRMRVSGLTTQVWDLEKDIPTDEKLFLRTILAASIPRAIDSQLALNFVMDILPSCITEDLEL